MMHHLIPVELSFGGVPRNVLKYESQTQLISGFILARLLSYSRSGQVLAALNCFSKAACRNVRVNETVLLSSLFPYLPKDTRFHSAIPVFISTTLCFAAAPCV